jgi:hypothetical protein
MELRKRVIKEDKNGALVKMSTTPKLSFNPKRLVEKLNR